MHPANLGAQSVEVVQLINRTAFTQVPDARMRDFYQLYCDTIEKHSLRPFLTEKSGPFSPILVDLDFKYDLSVTGRQY